MPDRRLASLLPPALAEERLILQFQVARRVTAAILILLAITTMAGWIFDFQLATRLGPEFPSMKFNAAVAILLMGWALVGDRPVQRRTRWLGGAVAVLGILTLAEHLGLHVSIDNLIFHQPREAADLSPGRPSALTALEFILLGVAIVCGTASRPRLRRLAETLALSALAIPTVVLLAYLHAASILIGRADFTSMAVPTAISLLLAAHAVLWSWPREGVMRLLVSPRAAGIEARRICYGVIPLVLLLFLCVVVVEVRLGLNHELAASLRSLILLGAMAISAWLALSRLHGVHAEIEAALDEARAIRATLEERVAARTTEVLKLNASIEAQRQWLQAILDNAPAVIFLKDIDGRYLSINRRYEELFGVDRAHIVGKTDYDLHPSDIADAVRANDRRVVDSGMPLDIEETVPSDGQPRAYMSLKFPMRDGAGRIIAVGGIATDITDKVRLEEQLQSNLSQLRNILETAPDGIIVIAANSRIESFNHAAELMFGYSASEVIGQPVTMLMPAESQQQHAAGLANYLMTGQTRMIGRTREVMALRADGTQLPLELTVSEHREGAARKFTGMLRDVRDRRRAEELGRQRQDLETLLHVASHDLREPLRAIESFGQMLHERYADRLDPKGVDFLTRVIRAADRMRRLIEDLVTLSRAQHETANPEPLPVEDLVRVALASLEERIRAVGARITVGYDLPTVLADRRWAVQAIYNLVANAVKFTHPGTPPEVTISAYVGPQEAGLVVADRGPGVPPECRDRIFQLFQRAVGREIEGTGAGLAIVRRIAERHGGRVWVEERDGGGAQFYLTFAVATAAEAA